MIIKAENINELLRLGFEPEFLVNEGNGKYSIDKAEFDDFAEGEDWEAGLDYSISNNEVTFSIVLTEEGYGERIEADPEYDESDDDEDDEDEVKNCIQELEDTLKEELTFLKDNTTSLQYCRTQMGLIKTILTH
jgi:hypothetical protein